jgi:hypothetical protein
MEQFSDPHYWVLVAFAIGFVLGMVTSYDPNRR